MSKYEQLYQDLKSEIIKCSPGAAFPSMRTIMKDYLVSQSTVTKATEMLFKNGFLQKIAGKEMIITDEVCKYKKGAAPVIGLALPHWQSDWNTRIEHCFYENKVNLGYELEVLHYDWHNKIITELPPTKIDGLVVIPSAGMISADEIKVLDHFNIPYLLFSRHLSGLAVNCVSADNRHSGAIAANHLIELGHRSIAAIITQPRVETIEERIDGFKSMCELRGIKFTTFDCEVSDGDYCPEKVYQKFTKRLRTGSLEFSGAMAMCQESCMAIYRAFHENNMKIPDDLSLIGIGGGEIYSYLCPPLTSLVTSTFEMVKEASNILKFKISNPENKDIIQKQIKPNIIVRQSTSPCKSMDLDINGTSKTLTGHHMSKILQPL
ncbi:MAG: substrate-binding domain-containing protein [Victivallales bacterium]|nr:substrate-binding domain-containing protein [Victivallales bacterium]